MAIQIINGKAVVTADTTSEKDTSSFTTSQQSVGNIQIVNGRAVVGTKTSKPPVTQSTQPSFFSQAGQSIMRDLPLVGEAALSSIPGLKYLWETKNQNLNIPQLGKAVGSDLGGMVKGLAGLPVRLGLSLTDLVGGPRKVDVPFIGEQTSPQEQARRLKASGAGPFASAVIPSAQFLFDVLAGKGGIEAVKNKMIVEPQKNLSTYTAQGMLGMKEPVKPQLQLPSGKEPIIPEPPRNFTPLNPELAGKPKEVLPQYLKEEPFVSKGEPKIKKPIETTIPKPSEGGDVQVTKILDQVIKPGPIKESIGDKMAKLNPFRFESGKIESYGPAGKELVARGRRAFNRSIITAGEFKKLNEKTGITKLSTEEQLNFRDVMEGKATPQSSTVASLVESWKPIFDKYGKDTGVQMMENYFPRRLNEAGRKFYELPENRDQIVEAIMKEHPGMDRTRAVEILGNGIKKGSFEFERLIQNVPSEYRKTPVEELYAWQNEVARRIGTIQEFGPKDEIARQLTSEIGKGSKYEQQRKVEAQAYVDRVAGRTYNISELDPVYNFLKGSMVVSKINPLTTISNELQGHINSYLQYGTKGLMDATFGKEGKKLVNELGLDTLKGKIGDEVAANSWATKWMKAVGMEGSEIRGFGRTAQSTYKALNRAFESLKKNPADRASYKLLKDHGMFLDDAELAQALRDGKIPDIEMKLGIVEGVRQKMFFQAPGERPTWANQPGLGVAYTFKNYALSQMQLLAKAPLHRQLAYTMIIAPLLGLPVLTLRRALQGRPLPDNPADLYVQAASSGPGTPFDIYQSATNKDFLLNSLLGGYSPIADIATASNKPKAIMNAVIPFSSYITSRLFPSKR